MAAGVPGSAARGSASHPPIGAVRTNGSSQPLGQPSQRAPQVNFDNWVVRLANLTQFSTDILSALCKQLASEVPPPSCLYCGPSFKELLCPLPPFHSELCQHNKYFFKPPEWLGG